MAAAEARGLVAYCESMKLETGGGISGRWMRWQI